MVDRPFFFRAHVTATLHAANRTNALRSTPSSKAISLQSRRTETCTARNWLSKQHNADSSLPGAQTAAAGTAMPVTQLPEIEVVATRLDPEGPRIAH